MKSQAGFRFPRQRRRKVGEEDEEEDGVRLSGGNSSSLETLRREGLRQ